MPDAFARFRHDFDARRITLVSNWRSHEDLVRVQHIIAQRIDPQSEQPEARAARSVNGDIAAIWEYQTDDQEAAGLAEWIATEIQNGIDPHEIAILARLRVNEVEESLAAFLLEHGVRLRNIARNVGEISIQDLLAEELTAVLVPLLRLGASSRDPVAWNRAQRSMLFLEGVYPDDESAQQRVQQRLQDFVRALRSNMSATAPSGAAAKVIANLALAFLGASNLRRAMPAYRRRQDFDRVWEGFATLLAESSEGAVTWTDALNQFEGHGQVALMTIHKSKGLEFHTIIFYGLDNQTWWSLTPDRVEELNSFFVALTRAQQRAFFTLCMGRGQPVAWIENLLAPAGVRRINGPPGHG